MGTAYLYVKLLYPSVRPKFLWKGLPFGTTWHPASFPLIEHNRFSPNCFLLLTKRIILASDVAAFFLSLSHTDIFGVPPIQIAIKCTHFTCTLILVHHLRNHTVTVYFLLPYMDTDEMHAFDRCNITCLLKISLVLYENRGNHNSMYLPNILLVYLGIWYIIQHFFSFF